MRFLDNTPDNYHEELKSYFPSWYGNVREMDAIWQISGEMLDELKQDAIRAIQNASLAACDMDTIRRIQDWAGISFNTGMSDEVLRVLFYLQVAGFGKCSRSKIIRLLRQLLGTEADVEFVPCDAYGNHVLRTLVDIGESEAWDPADIETLLERIVPAHLLRETKYVRYIQADGGFWVGFALHHYSKLTLTMQAVTDDDLGDCLVDETGAILMDEAGTVIGE